MLAHQAPEAGVLVDDRLAIGGEANGLGGAVTAGQVALSAADARVLVDDEAVAQGGKPTWPGHGDGVADHLETARELEVGRNECALSAG